MRKISPDHFNEASTVKVRGNLLIFGNCAIQISNISEIIALDLTSVRKLPKLAILLLFVGIILAIYGENEFEPEATTAGSIAIVVSIIWIIVYIAMRKRRNFGLYLLTNAGKAEVIISKDFEFVKKAAIALMQSIERESENLTINFDQRQITNDVSASEGAIVVGGDVEGDISSKIN